MTTPRTDAAYKTRIEYVTNLPDDLWQNLSNGDCEPAKQWVANGPVDGWNFARQLETELIALKEENLKLKKILCTDSAFTCLNHNDKERSEVKCGVCLKKERDQLLATVEGLREILQEIKHENSATYREAAETGHSEGMWIKPSISTKIDQALQSSFPQINLVKRSVLEKAYDSIGCGCGGDFGLCETCSSAFKEAHEELQRTKPV